MVGFGLSGPLFTSISWLYDDSSAEIQALVIFSQVLELDKAVMAKKSPKGMIDCIEIHDCRIELEEGYM